MPASTLRLTRSAARPGRSALCLVGGRRCHVACLGFSSPPPQRSSSWRWPHQPVAPSPPTASPPRCRCSRRPARRTTPPPSRRTTRVTATTASTPTRPSPSSCAASSSSRSPRRPPSRRRPPVWSRRTRQRAALPVAGGSWDEVTDKPFLNDPVDRGANFGVGWGDVTGRMTAFTHSGTTVYAAAASGGVWRSTNNGKHLASRSNDGLPRLSVGALATDPSDGSVWVGTGEANNASENQYGVGVYRLATGSTTWQQVGGSELYGAGSYRIAWINGYVYVATSHGLYRRRGACAPRARRGSSVLRPAGRQGLPAELVGDRRARGARHERRQDPRRRRLGRLQRPARDRATTASTSAPARRAASPGSRRPVTSTRTTIGRDDVQLVATAGCTRSCRTPRPTTCAARAPSCPSRGNPAGPWTRIADVDKLADSDSALGRLDQSRTTRASRPTTTSTSSPTRRTASTSTCSSRRSSSRPTAGRPGTTVGPYWNYDISCDPDDDDPVQLPADDPPRPARRDDLQRPVLGGQRRRRVAPSADLAHSAATGPTSTPRLHTTQNYSIAVGKVGKRPRLLGRPAGQRRVLHAHRPWPASSRRSPVTAATPSSTRRTATARSRSTSTSTCSSPPTAPSHDAAGDLAVLPDGDRPAGRTATRTRGSSHRSRWTSTTQTTGSPAASTCGTTRSRGTPSARGADGCDWKKVYDTGDGHQVTALAANGSDDVRRLVRRLQPADLRPGPGHQLRRGAGTSCRCAGVPEPLHHLDRGRPAERGARLHQHRLVQPPLDPGRRASVTSSSRPTAARRGPT